MTDLDIAEARPGCLLCGLDVGQELTVKSGYVHKRCPCGSVYLSPPVAASAYDPTIESHDGSFYQRSAARKLSWLQRSIQRGRLLEVGCGNGHFLAAARHRGFDVAGIEAHPERARHAAARLGCEVECAQVEQTRLPDATFDVVYHCDLLSHFPAPDRALRAMAGLLAPGGALFFEVALHDGVGARHFRNMPDRAAPRHRWYFTLANLRALLERNDLVITRLRRFGLGPQVAAYYVTRAATRFAALVDHRRGPANPIANALPPAEPPPPPRWLAAYEDFLRHRVGALTPANWGPSTAFVVAHPR